MITVEDLSYTYPHGQEPAVRRLQSGGVTVFLTTHDMTVAMGSAIVLFVGYGFGGYDPVWLLIGLVTLSLAFTLAGFIQVSRLNSVTGFIVYAIPVILISQLPLLDYTGLAPSLAWYVIPSMGPLILLDAAFGSVTAWQLAYGLLYSLASALALFWWARHAFQRNIVLRPR